MGLLSEFKEFAARGNVIDMAVGIVIGAAFGAITKSFVDDVLMPPIGMLLGGVDFGNIFLVLKEGATPAPYASMAAAKEAGAVVMGVGLFIQTIINFLIIAFAIFMLIKSVNRLKEGRTPQPAAAPTTRDCPYCTMAIPIGARRCPQCTSPLD